MEVAVLGLGEAGGRIAADLVAAGCSVRAWDPAPRSADVPRAASEILNRLNEVAFNAVLLKELRMIALLRRVADPGHDEGAKWAKMRVHSVTNEIMKELSASSKMIAEWDFLCLLRDKGRVSAQSFLDQHVNNLGRRSTLDLDVLLESI